MDTDESTVKEFHKLAATLTGLSDAEGLMEWDMQTYMPPGADAGRGEQLAVLAGVKHQLLTSDSTVRLVNALRRDVAGLDEQTAASLRIIGQDMDRALKVPEELVAELARLQSEGQTVWARARQDNDFAAFAPVLERIVDAVSARAGYLGYESVPYDALLDLYEPGNTQQSVAEVFAAVRTHTVDLLDRIRSSGVINTDAVLRRDYPEELQEQFGREIAAQIGFDFTRGRLDRAVHPFEQAIGRDDVRITTRYDRNFLNTAIFGILHEAGHGMYEQGAAPGLRGTPLGTGTSMAVHESQSRLWENIVGRSLPFWEGTWPRMQELFGSSLADVSAEQFYAASNVVAPSLIRVEADEVTYNLHIMIRFELESQLINGTLAVKDLPEAWNALYREYLGLIPPDDTHGVLQDVHWSAGLFGYFPSYALGNIMSAQFMQACRSDIPDLDDQIRQGEFGNLLGWLQENIYRHGSIHEPLELLKRVTGSGLDAEPYIKYLNDKFGRLYPQGGKK